MICHAESESIWVSFRRVIPSLEAVGLGAVVAAAMVLSVATAAHAHKGKTNKAGQARQNYLGVSGSSIEFRNNDRSLFCYAETIGEIMKVTVTNFRL